MKQNEITMIIYRCFFHPGIPKFDDGVTIENIDIVMQGGFPVRTINDARREIPEVSNKYPENRMFGVLPAYGFYIRHARNIRIKDVRLSIRQKHERSAILLDDVYQASVDRSGRNRKSVTPYLDK